MRTMIPGLKEGKPVLTQGKGRSGNRRQQQDQILLSPDPAMGFGLMILEPAWG
jgi:hypothetical protein